MISLVPMMEGEFANYMVSAVKDYADLHVRAGDVFPEEALMRVQKDSDELLPDGLRSKNQYLFTVTHDALGAIGMVWYALRERETRKSAYLYDFKIQEDLRGQGYGRQTLELLEKALCALGVQRIGLNVFGFNVAARPIRKGGIPGHRYWHDKEDWSDSDLACSLVHTSAANIRRKFKRRRRSRHGLRRPKYLPMSRAQVGSRFTVTHLQENRSPYLPGPSMTRRHGVEMKMSISREALRQKKLGCVRARRWIRGDSPD